MSSFRNIIARRRPAPSADQPESAPQQATPQDVAKVETLLEEISEQSPSRLVDVPPAPPEVPRWELEPPMRTMGEELLTPVAEEGAEEEVAETPEADPAPITERRKIWDLDAKSDAVAPAEPEIHTDTPEEPPAANVLPEVTKPALSSPAPTPSRGGRVKTRLLGFHTDDAVADAFAQKSAPAAAQSVKFPVGWVVIVEGPGQGTSFALSPGLSTLGRGADQTIPIDFGDDCISRDTHASIAYDDEENKILIGHGGKSNLVRLNDKPLVSATELHSGDQFRIGKTTLRFIALCGGDFRWPGQADNV